MNIVFIKIQVSVILIICTIFGVSYGEETECVIAINDVFKNCENCTTIENQISYIMRRIVPKNIKNKHAIDYMDHLYYAIKIRDPPVIQNPTDVQNPTAVQNPTDVKNTTDIKNPTDVEKPTVNYTMISTQFCMFFYTTKIQNCINFFKNIGLFHNYAKNNVFSVYYNHSMLMYPCETVKKREKIHHCNSDFFKNYVKKLVETIDIDVNNLKQLDRPDKFCLKRACNHAIEESLLAIGNCKILDDYLINAIYFLDYTTVNDEWSKEYIEKLFDMSLIDNILSPNEFCDSIKSFPLHGVTPERCKHDLIEANLAMNQIKENVKHIYYNITVDNVKNFISLQNIEIMDAENTSNFFNPVTYEWQKAMSAKLGLKVKCINLFYSIRKKIHLPFSIKKIKQDGNCYFRALSVWITGDESNHFEIRQALVKFMMESPQMAHYMDGKDKLIKYLIENKMANNQEWATTVEIYATSIFLNTTIMVYEFITNDWQVYSKALDFSQKIEKNEKCIYLQFTNNNHYDVITSVKEYPAEINYLEKYIIHVADTISIHYAVQTKRNKYKLVHPEPFCIQKTIDILKTKD